MKSAAILPAALICAQFAIARMSYERLRNADQEPGSWLTYSGAYHGQRFSKLDQISTGNVADLRPVWVYQVEGSGEIETTPLVADGVMYVTELEARVTALDVRTGRPLWTYQHAMPEGVLNIGFRPDQPRRRTVGRDVLFRNPRCAPRRSRREVRRAALEDEGRREQAGLLDHGRSAGD